MQTLRKVKTASEIAALISSGKYLYTTARESYSKYQTKRSFEIVVQENNKLFDKLEKWVLTQLKEEDQKSIGASIISQELKLFYTGAKEHTVRLGTETVTFHLTEDKDADKSDEDLTQLLKKYKPRSIVFRANTLTGKQEIIKLLESIKNETIAETDPPKVRTYKWGGWQEGKEIPNRPLESVVLKKGQLERIVDDVQKFLDDRSKYEKIGAPWHRGYLLHGPPGTGKTSIAVALAKHFGLDLNFCSLGDIEKDAVLIQIISQAKGILLIEDADVFEAVVESRDQKEKSASLSGLLNSLDGVLTPNGLITIVTTNKIDKLDPALIRSGRIDMVEEINYLDVNQLKRLFKFIYKKDLEVNDVNINLTPSDVVEIFKTVDDPEVAAEHIRNLVDNE